LFLKFENLNDHLFISQIVVGMLSVFVIIFIDKADIFIVFLTSLGFEQY